MSQLLIKNFFFRFKKGRTDGARVNVLNPTDKLLSFYYEDAKTLYEVFKKGKQLSSTWDSF